MVVEQHSEVGPASRRDRLRALMREDILRAARAIVQEHGFKDLSIRELAKAVGVTAPTLYDYYPSKDALLDALYVEGAQTLREAFEEVVASTPRGLPRLRALGSAYRRFALDHPDLFLLVFGRIDASYRPSEEKLEHAAAVFEILVRALAEAMDVGHLRRRDPRVVGNALWAMAHGQVVLEISGLADRCAADDLSRQYEENFDLLLEGLGATGG